LAGLPPALIASAQHDLLHIEAEKYAGELIAAGVPTEVTRHVNASHNGLVADPSALADVVAFFKKRLRARTVSSLAAH
jgi:acetyl esterase/lipase